MNYRSAKKRGLVRKGRGVETLGSCMDQGSGAKGYGGFKTMAGDMGQGDRPRKFHKSKLGDAMNQ